MPLISTLANASARGYGMFGSVGIAGDYQSIATVTVGSGGSSSISFSSIPSTFKHLQLRVLSRGTDATNGGVQVWMRFNGDTAGNYSWHNLVGYQGAGSGVSAGAGTSTSYMYNSYQPSAGQASGIFGAALTDILDYASVDKYKTIRSLNGYDMNGSTSGYNYANLFSGNWRSTSAVTSIDLICNTGNFDQYSSFALYGIKG